MQLSSWKWKGGYYVYIKRRKNGRERNDTKEL
jgi:hypothetical protein